MPTFIVALKNICEVFPDNNLTDLKKYDVFHPNFSAKASILWLLGLRHLFRKSLGGGGKIKIKIIGLHTWKKIISIFKASFLGGGKIFLFVDK